jgi:hypothetical protein
MLLKAGVGSIFANLGFYVTEFSFNKILPSREIRDIIKRFYKDTSIAHLLIYSPELFIMHRKMPPEKGVFFIKCIVAHNKGKLSRFAEIEKEAWDIYNKFYPSDKIVVVIARNHKFKTFLAEFMSNLNDKIEPSKRRMTLIIKLNGLFSIERFTYLRLKMKINRELLNDFRYEMLKTFQSGC